MQHCKRETKIIQTLLLGGWLAGTGTNPFDNQGMRLSDYPGGWGKLNRLMSLEIISNQKLKYKFQNDASLELEKSGDDIKMTVCEPEFRKKCLTKMMHPLNRTTWKSFNSAAPELDKIGEFILP